MKKKPSVLAIDWWSMYIWLAYMPLDEVRMIFPIGYVYNDKMIYTTIADLVQRYYVHTIVIGKPNTQDDIKRKIDAFVESLSFVIDMKMVDVQFVNEDYTSVEAGNIVSSFKKNVAEDTVSAMLILERWKKEQVL